MADGQIKVDLHTHSIASKDGGISEKQYLQALDSSRLHAIAITDHNRIDFAQNLANQRPRQIIVGEEIITREGEMIGLFLSEPISSGLSAIETAQLILAQNAIVYIPHPLERLRSGLKLATLDSIVNYIDALELYNGRAWFGPKKAASLWSQQHGIPLLAGSDAHTAADLGRTYSLFAEFPSPDTFHHLAEESTMSYKKATLRGRIAPTINRVRNRKRFS